MFDQMKALKALSSLMANREEIQAKMQQFQAELAKKEVEADAGAGAVRVTVNGKMEVRRVELDPTMIATLSGDTAEDDKALIEELIVSATNLAMAKAQELARDEMAKVAGGLGLPGMGGLEGLLGSGGA